MASFYSLSPSLVAMLWILLVICVCVNCQLGSSATRTIRIAGMFEAGYDNEERAFRNAIDRVNSRTDILPDIKLSYEIETPRLQDSFSASQKGNACEGVEERGRGNIDLWPIERSACGSKSCGHRQIATTVCRQIKQGVAAVFGPMSHYSSEHVQSVCSSLGIPHLEIRWNINPVPNKDSNTINLYPQHAMVGKAFIDAAQFWHWDTFAILYERSDGLLRLQELIKGPTDTPFKITVRRLTPEKGLPGRRDDYRPILKELREMGVSRIVLDCHWSKVIDILHQAMTINMTTQYYHYMLTTLDIGLLDLDDFRYGGTNITAFRLINPNSPLVTEIANDWRFDRKLTGTSPLTNDRGFSNASWGVTMTETAMMYDAVHLFAMALDHVDMAQDIQTERLSCTKEKSWQDGDSFFNYMRMIQMSGLTGPIAFDGYGRRKTFILDLVELTQKGMEQVGFWKPEGGLNITKNFTKSMVQLANSLKNQTLIVTTILEDPYVMIIEDPDKKLRGNARYEGYCVDLLREIASILHFNYTIKEVSDGTYGSLEGKNEWTGMVRELADRKADLAVASLTISWVREQVIDFTKPFMNLGISIIFKKPEKKNPSLFSFLSPLSFEIWIYMVAAYLAVSFTMFVLARFSPYEWYNPHPCNPDCDVVENQFTLINSLWFTIGSLMQQGCEISPRATSTRVVSTMWWFFTLIMISSYTANLAAFLTVERMTSPIENADDLSKQTEIQYGSVYGGSTQTFFKTSKIQTYQRMWNFMGSAKPSVFVNSTKEGIERVLKGNYAYLLESSMNQYITERNCELMQVGGMLDSKGYGIGTPMGSPYRDLISDVILKLQEDQSLQMLYNKWWKEKGGAGQCIPDDKNKKDANALAIANVGGVFVLLVAGLILSLIVSLLEFVWKSHRSTDPDKPPVCQEIAEDLRFALQCFGPDTKPVKRPRQRKLATEHLEGNGLSTMPLTGYPMHNHSVPIKDIYT